MEPSTKSTILYYSKFAVIGIIAIGLLATSSWLEPDKPDYNPPYNHWYYDYEIIENQPELVTASPNHFLFRTNQTENQRINITFSFTRIGTFNNDTHWFIPIEVTDIGSYTYVTNETYGDTYDIVARTQTGVFDVVFTEGNTTRTGLESDRHCTTEQNFTITMSIGLNPMCLENMSAYHSTQIEFETWLPINPTELYTRSVVRIGYGYDHEIHYLDVVKLEG